MCACHACMELSRDTYREALLQTLSPRLTVNAVNCPEWNPGERFIIRNGFGGAVHGTGLLLSSDAGCEALCAFVPWSGGTLPASPPAYVWGSGGKFT
jgi:hypothetical protein